MSRRLEVAWPAFYGEGSFSSRGSNDPCLRCNKFCGKLGVSAGPEGIDFGYTALILLAKGAPFTPASKSDNQFNLLQPS